MDIQKHIKILGIVMAIFSLLGLMFVDYGQNAVQQIIIYGLITAINLLIIYLFIKGKNWARIFVIIGAILNLPVFFVMFFSKLGFLRTSFQCIDTLFSVYLLFYLSKASVISFFKPTYSALAKPRKALRIILISSVIAILLI